MLDTTSTDSSNIEISGRENFTSEFKLHFQLQRDLHDSTEGNKYLLKLDFGYECKTTNCLALRR